MGPEFRCPADSASSGLDTSSNQSYGVSMLLRIGQLTLMGILAGGIYGLTAMGLSLIFGVMKVINFAHGQLMVIGMFLTYWILVVFGIDPSLSFLIAAFLVFLLGYFFQAVLVNRIIDYPVASQVLVLIGLGLILENVLLLVFGPDHRSVNTSLSLKTFWVAGLMVDMARLAAFILAMGIALALFVFVKKTDIGRALRASADNRLGARLAGINVNRVQNVCFGIGAATAAAAGAFLTALMPINPHMGHAFTMTAFIIVILGGMGNMKGALVGGIVLGMAEALSTLFLLPSLKQIVSFAILIAIMLWRPQGLFGEKV